MTQHSTNTHINTQFIGKTVALLVAFPHFPQASWGKLNETIITKVGKNKTTLNKK